MWAVKPHYYGSHFYNWPYTYGLLFGLGLFAQYQRRPRALPRRLRRRAVARRHGHRRGARRRRSGSTSPDEAFWTASLDVLPRPHRRSTRALAARWTGRTVMTHAATTPSRDELAELLAGEPRYRVDQVWQGLYAAARRRRPR